METLPVMIACSFLAGFVDAVAGGGGLIQLPALLMLFPSLAPAVLLSTNKYASLAGSLAAALTYLRRVPVEWRVVRLSILSAVAASALAAFLVELLPVDYFRPLMSIMVAVAALRIMSLRVEGPDRTATAKRTPGAIMAVTGLAGLYDGFFGPGTGTILMYLLVSHVGLEFVSASASAKFINLGTNLGAIIYFSSTGSVNLSLALPLAAANVVGGVLGPTRQCGVATASSARWWWRWR